ncbi:MAG: Ltp family lipoprotein [Lachnospira sp.]|nr:Ltp family lipoprotein [Lachnospira sp.]
MSKENKGKKKKWPIILGVIIIIAIIGSVGGVQSEKKDPSSISTSTSTSVGSEISTEINSTASSVPIEYKTALNKAKQYSDTMHMSKQGLYNQLTSEYGEKYTPEAAQYAVDNLDVNWSENALKKAQTYQTEMSMSPAAIYDQLISEYGEQFTAEEAQYAIDNLK